MAGGPIKAAWLDCEGASVFSKRFEKRYVVLWPRNYKKLSRPAPSLFLWEDDISLVGISKPSRVLPLFGMEVDISDKLAKGNSRRTIKLSNSPKNTGDSHPEDDRPLSAGYPFKAQTQIMSGKDSDETHEWIAILKEFAVRLKMF